jgi:hypothetical protein
MVQSVIAKIIGMEGMKILPNADDDSEAGNMNGSLLVPVPFMVPIEPLWYSFIFELEGETADALIFPMVSVWLYALYETRNCSPADMRSING